MDGIEDAGEFVIETLHALYSDADIAVLDRRAAYPLTVMTPNVDFALQGIEDLDRTVTLLRQGLRSAGVVGLQPRIQTVFQPEDGMAVISTRNTRLGADGQDLGTHRSTYIIRRLDRWRFKALSINDEAHDSLRERIELLLESEGIMRRLPGGRGDMT